MLIIRANLKFFSPLIIYTILFLVSLAERDYVLGTKIEDFFYFCKKNELFLIKRQKNSDSLHNRQ